MYVLRELENHFVEPTNGVLHLGVGGVTRDCRGHRFVREHPSHRLVVTGVMAEVEQGGDMTEEVGVDLEAQFPCDAIAKSSALTPHWPSVCRSMLEKAQ